MEHHVSLDGFPDGLIFPDAYADRIVYDAAARRLRYHGFMSKADFDRLYQAHENWPYRRALEELFRLCSQAESSPHAGAGLARLFRKLRGEGPRPSPA